VRTSKARMRGAVGTRGVFSDLVLFAAVGILASVHAWTRVQGTLTGYDLSAAQAEQRELLRESRSLRLELATRRAASRIEADAHARLGLTEPSPDRIYPVRTQPAPAPQRAAFAAAERRR
jgi:cell division protein FtsL